MLMSVLSRNHPASMPAKQAGYAYIAQFGAICRMQHLPPEHGEQSHLVFSPLISRDRVCHIVDLKLTPAMQGRAALLASVLEQPLLH